MSTRNEPRYALWSAILFVLLASFPIAVLPQSSNPPSTDVNAAVKLDYPDSPSGLERLVKDILKAQKSNDGTRADALLRSLVLSAPRTWYDDVFGSNIAAETEALYEKSAASLPPSIARYLLDAQTRQLDSVNVVRFEKSCDDNSGEDTFGILHARRHAVPLYELRLIHGDKFNRLFAFAYVDGGFRFILPPKLHGNIFRTGNWDTNSAIASEELRKKLPEETRLRMGGTVQAAKLIHKVQPVYPDLARHEHLQGTVTMHALINAEGAIAQLYVIKGYCSLAESSLAAVSQWRYSPTLFNGKPVEVDTEIQAIFSLKQ